MSVYYDEAKKTYYCKFSYVDWTGKTRWTTKRGFDGKKKAAKYEREFKQNNKESPNITVSESYTYTIGRAERWERPRDSAEQGA